MWEAAGVGVRITKTSATCRNHSDLCRLYNGLNLETKPDWDHKLDNIIYRIEFIIDETSIFV